MLGTSAGWMAALMLNRALREGEIRGPEDAGMRPSRASDADSAEEGGGTGNEARGKARRSNRKR
jgi:hypothetical protein